MVQDPGKKSGYCPTANRFVPSRIGIIFFLKISSKSVHNCLRYTYVAQENSERLLWKRNLLGASENKRG